MRHPNWTECDGGWSSGPYLIEMLAHDLWVLSRRRGLDWEILTTAASASELEAFSSAHRGALGAHRPIVLGTAYLAAVAAVIAGSVSGSTFAVLMASGCMIGVMARFAEYMTARRVVRARMPASVR